VNFIDAATDGSLKAVTIVMAVVANIIGFLALASLVHAVCRIFGSWYGSEITSSLDVSCRLSTPQTSLELIIGDIVYILSLKKIGNSHVSNLLRFCN
jgi:nucleoside permease NupC